MNTSASAVRFDGDSMWVEPSDGRVIAVPLAWFARRMNATAEQRAQVVFGARGLRWEGLDEDIPIDGLLAGSGNMTRQNRATA